VSGLGFSLVSAPLLVVLLGARAGIQISVVLSMVVNAGVLVREWRRVHPRVAALLLVSAAPLTPVFAWLLRGARSGPLEVLAGCAILGGVGMLASGRRLGWAAGRAGAVAAGAISAGMNVVAASGGPPVALWMANAGWEAAAARATLQAYFLTLNVVALASLGPPRLGYGRVLPLLAALLVGALVGARVARRVDDRMARGATLAIAGAGALALVVVALA